VPRGQERGKRREKEEGGREEVRKGGGGENGLGSGGERTAKACPSDDFLAGPAKWQSQTGCPREEKDPRKKADTVYSFSKRVGIRGNGESLGNDDGEGDGETQERLGEASNR